jgi:hypothetical protein
MTAAKVTTVTRVATALLTATAIKGVVKKVGRVRGKGFRCRRSGQPLTLAPGSRRILPELLLLLAQRAGLGVDLGERAGIA